MFTLPAEASQTFLCPRAESSNLSTNGPVHYMPCAIFPLHFSAAAPRPNLFHLSLWLPSRPGLWTAVLFTRCGSPLRSQRQPNGVSESLNSTKWAKTLQSSLFFGFLFFYLLVKTINQLHTVEGFFRKCVPLVWLIRMSFMVDLLETHLWLSPHCFLTWYDEFTAVCERTEPHSNLSVLSEEMKKKMSVSRWVLINMKHIPSLLLGSRLLLIYYLSLSFRVVYPVTSARVSLQCSYWMHTTCRGILSNKDRKKYDIFTNLKQ